VANDDFLAVTGMLTGISVVSGQQRRNGPGDELDRCAGLAVLVAVLVRVGVAATEEEPSGGSSSSSSRRSPPGPLPPLFPPSTRPWQRLRVKLESPAPAPPAGGGAAK
jgi:hypothetical protein